MAWIDKAPRVVRSAVGGTFAPRFVDELPKDYEGIPQAVHLSDDSAKAGELLIASGLGLFRTDDATIRVIADVDRLPRRLRRQVRRGQTDQRVFVTHTEGRSLLRPLNPAHDELIINLTTLPEALSRSVGALNANEDTVREQNRAELTTAIAEKRPAFVAPTTRASVAEDVERQVNTGVVLEAKRLAHQHWHHRVLPVAGSLVTGGVFAGIGRVVTGLVTNGVPPEHIAHTPFTLPGILTFVGGLGAANLYNRFVAHPRHVAKSDQQVAQYTARHGNDRVVGVRLR